MSVSYRVEIERGAFYPGGEWRALVYKDDEVVNCFIGRTASLVMDEATTAVNWHDARDDSYSVRVNAETMRDANKIDTTTSDFIYPPAS